MLGATGRFGFYRGDRTQPGAQRTVQNMALWKGDSSRHRAHAACAAVTTSQSGGNLVLVRGHSRAPPPAPGGHQPCSSPWTRLLSPQPMGRDPTVVTLGLASLTQRRRSSPSSWPSNVPPSPCGHGPCALRGWEQSHRGLFPFLFWGL